MTQVRYNGDEPTIRHGYPTWEPGEVREVAEADEVAELATNPLFEVVAVKPAKASIARGSTSDAVTEPSAEAAPAAEANSTDA